METPFMVVLVKTLSFLWAPRTKHKSSPTSSSSSPTSSSSLLWTWVEYDQQQQQRQRKSKVIGERYCCCCCNACPSATSGSSMIKSIRKCERPQIRRGTTTTTPGTRRKWSGAAAVDTEMSTGNSDYSSCCPNCCCEGGGDDNDETENCRRRREQWIFAGKKSNEQNDDDAHGDKSRNECDSVLMRVTKRRSERKGTMMSVLSSRNVVLALLVFLWMCQVSEECPAVCECKWKSGKESVICANSKTKLTEIPSGLEPGTQVLDLSGNSIKALPANVFLSLNLLNLQKIYLSDCSLKSLDRLAFAKLKNLVELDLSANRQEFVPSHAFGQIPELRELKMNSNPISRLSNDAFVDLPRLVRLEMSGCRIGTIEIWAFRGLPALEWLRLDNNQLFTVQATSFLPLRSLHGLEIHGNPWNCTCTLQPFREWMGKNNVPFGVPPVCSSPHRLVGKLWNVLALEDFACLPKLHRLSGNGAAAVSNNQRKILEGENTTLTCQWEATPDTKIRWFNGNKLVGTGSGASGFVVSESFRWELNTSPPGKKSREYGQSSSFPSYSKNSVSNSNSMMALESPSQWDRGGVGLKTSNLMVIRTTPRDAGTYTCRAESRAGYASANYTVIVVQKKGEHLTGRFLLFGAVLAALLTLMVSLLLVCVVFGSNRRHYQSSRIATDDKVELNHVGGTHILGQNGGGSVPLIGNHHNSNHHNNRHSTSNHAANEISVTTNCVLSGRSVIGNGESNHTLMSSGGGTTIGIGVSDKGREYRALPTQEPDSSSEMENNGSDQDDEEGAEEVLGEVDQAGDAMEVGRIISPVAPDRSRGGPATQVFVGGQNRRSNLGPMNQSQQFKMVMVRKPSPGIPPSPSCRESKIGVVMGDSDPSSSSGTFSQPLHRNKEGKIGPQNGNIGGGNGNVPFSDTYPDLIDEKMNLSSDFSSLPRPNKNEQQQKQYQHPLASSSSTTVTPFKQHLAHPKQHLVDSTRGYFHRRNNSDSQSPLLSRSYGNSTEQITSSGISILSSSSTESSYVSTYQPPYTISQGHLHQPQPPQYRGSFKGSSGVNYQQSSTQNKNPFNSYGTNYGMRHRLSMPTSPVHDHYFIDQKGAPPAVGAMRHHSGSHDEGRGGLLSPTTEQGISYVRTASSGPVGPPSNSVGYDYHAAQLAAFLEEYRQLQLELMRMSASLQQQGNVGGNESGGRPQVQENDTSPLSDSSSVMGGGEGGNSNLTELSLKPHQNPGSHSHHDLSNANNATSILFKSASSSHAHSSPQQTHHLSPHPHQHHHQKQHQLKSILKNSGNNNNYLA